MEDANDAAPDDSAGPRARRREGLGRRGDRQNNRVNAEIIAKCVQIASFEGE
jgi:hypothetical protein